MATTERFLGTEEIDRILLKLNSRPTNQPDEEWKHFCIGYFISNKGRVYNSRFDRDIKTYSNGAKTNRHKCFEMCHNGQVEKIFVHMAVYYCFGKLKDVLYPCGIMSRNSAYVVHHINNISTDNDIKNLYLMTKKMHCKLNVALLHKQISQSDIDTADKLDQWVMLNTNALAWFTDDKNKKVGERHAE